MKNSSLFMKTSRSILLAGMVFGIAVPFMPKAARVQAVLPGAAQAVARAPEPPLVAQRSLAAECLARVDPREPANHRP